GHRPKTRVGLLKPDPDPFEEAFATQIPDAHDHVRAADPKRVRAQLLQGLLLKLSPVTAMGRVAGVSQSVYRQANGTRGESGIQGKQPDFSPRFSCADFPRV